MCNMRANAWTTSAPIVKQFVLRLQNAMFPHTGCDKGSSGRLALHPPRACYLIVTAARKHDGVLECAQYKTRRDLPLPQGSYWVRAIVGTNCNRPSPNNSTKADSSEPPSMFLTPSSGATSHKPTTQVPLSWVLEVVNISAMTQARQGNIIHTQRRS